MRETPGALPGEPVPDEAQIENDRILSECSRMIADRALFGAEVNPEILKKSESGAKFLIRDPPPPRRLLALWRSLFGNRISPIRLLELLAPTIQTFGHRESMLLFARDRLIYTTRIIHFDEIIGDMTLYFRTEFERGEGFLG